MHVKNKADVKEPFISSSGEKIFELIGRDVKLGGNESFGVAYVIIDGHGKSPEHDDEFDEAYYIKAGVGTMTIDGDSKKLVRGDCCLIKAQSVHQIVNNHSSPLEFIVISAPAFDPAKHHE